METRLNLFEKGLKAMKPLFSMGAYLAQSPVEEHLLNLVYFRVSQINGCAYCLDMHSKDLRAKGETEQRLYMISAWHETDLYTEREKAALAYAEALTNITEVGVPDSVYNDLIEQFSDEEIVDLTMAIVTINSYNRINVAFKTPAGNYQPGQHAALAN
jgi:AhpD family alkylhydroperoxidase